MDKEHADVMEPSSSNTGPGSSKEVIGSTSEVIHIQGGDKEDRITNEKEKAQSESQEESGNVHVDLVEIKESEQSDTVMILDEVQTESATEKQDTIDIQKHGKADMLHDGTVSHSHLSVPGSQNKKTGESKHQTITRSTNISATSIQFSADSVVSEQDTSEPPQKRSRIDTDSVVDISERDIPDKTDVIEVIQIDPLVDVTKPDNELQSNIVSESTDLEIIETKETTGMKQFKGGVNLAQTKAISDVILIDEQNTDSRGSAATDDSVIFVDEGMKENTHDTPQHSTSQPSKLYDFSRTPRLITGAWKCFESSNHDNYLRGCKWAPDGTCLLTNSNDNCLRLFNLPPELYMEGGEDMNIAEMVPVLKMKEADTIYDYCWYPKMSSASAETACLAVTSKDTPIHLYDAFTGELRCSYRAFNHVDEVAPAHSLSFNPDGSKLYCGFNKMIRVFDVTRPGREFENRPTFAKQGQPGIISCIAHSPTESGLYAAGSYARAIALYQEPQGEMICMFQGQQGGVTQLAFSTDGTKLYSGGRKDPEILCWDMRNPGQILFTLIRRVETNQRIYFDQTLDGRYLVSGSHDSSVLAWDTEQPPSMILPDSDPLLKPVSIYPAHNDTVNGVSLHPSLPLIATSSGRRHFPDIYDSDDSDIETSDNDNVIENSLKLWWL